MSFLNSLTVTLKNKILSQFCSEEKDDTLSAISGGSLKPEIAGHQMTSSVTATTPTLTIASITGNVPTASPEVDDEDFNAKPPEHLWNKNGSPQKSNCCQLYTLIHPPVLPPFFLFLDKFYSSSDSDSDDEIERKIHVEIKPLNNGTDKISASVDELRATVENLSLSPIGVLSVISHCLESSFCTLF